jgi:hypothetical protein
MSISSDYVKIGRLRMSKKRFKRRVYQVISFFIVFLFLGGLIVTILLGTKYF